MNGGNIAPLCFAAPLVICLIVREINWRKRITNWEKSTGRYLGEQRDEKKGDYYPVVGYLFEGENLEQFCEFNLYNPQLGEEVEILVNPETGCIELYTRRARWFLSFFLIGCIVALCLLSYVSH